MSQNSDGAVPKISVYAPASLRSSVEECVSVIPDVVIDTVRESTRVLTTDVLLTVVAATIGIARKLYRTLCL